MDEADTGLLGLILDGVEAGRISSEDLMKLLAVLPSDKRGWLAVESIRRSGESPGAEAAAQTHSPG